MLGLVCEVRSETSINEVNTLLADGWITLEMLSTSKGIEFIMGRIEKGRASRLLCHASENCQ